MSARCPKPNGQINSTLRWMSAVRARVANGVSSLSKLTDARLRGPQTPVVRECLGPPGR